MSSLKIMSKLVFLGQGVECLGRIDINLPDAIRSGRLLRRTRRNIMKFCRCLPAFVPGFASTAAAALAAAVHREDAKAKPPYIL